MIHGVLNCIMMVHSCMHLACVSGNSMIPYFAIVAGICAAFASTVGKVATSPSDLFPHRLLCLFLQQSGGIGKPCTGSVCATPLCVSLFPSILSS